MCPRILALALAQVGAVDSIIDTVGACLGLHLLGVDEVRCSFLPFGDGAVRGTAHGTLPVPAPATLRLMMNVPTRPGPRVSGELVTPTGAALVRALVLADALGDATEPGEPDAPCGPGELTGRFGRPPTGFVPLRVGIGAGTKDFADHPNILRLVLGEVVV